MSIVLQGLGKRFAGQVVLEDVSLEIPNGELFVLLGSSGSGKSTVLRLIAGLTDPSEGRILIHGRDVTTLSPQKRGTGFVFQNYSIFRHMSVAQNIEFGLRIRKVPAAERAQKREQLLDMVGLGGLGGRYADQLSGGQQQRVALARALAYEPGVLLLYEPFGALDVKIRGQIRRSLKEIQRQLKLTTILVTHDQEEAFELADRIGVVDRGRLVEVGTAEELYARPRALFTATFLGGGNVLVGRARSGQAQFGPLTLPIPEDAPHEEGARVQLLVRPEHIALSAAQPGPEVPLLGQGSVIEQTFTGPLRRVRLRLPHLPFTRQIAPPVPFGEENMLIDAQLPTDAPLDTSDVWVGLRRWQILQRPPPRLLVYDAPAGPVTHLALARWLAEHWGAAPSVLAVAATPEEAEQAKAALVKRFAEAGLLAVEPLVRQGGAYEQLMREHSESLYEMLLLPAGAGPVESVSALSYQVLEQPGIPVLVVKGKRPGLRRILICTAGGEPGKADVRGGGQLAQRVGAEVTLLYIARKQNLVSRLTTLHLERAAATVRAMDVKAEIKIRSANKPVDGILAEAREGDYDLIVIGSHGPPLRSAFPTDDVTIQTVARADRSVLIIPPEER